MKRFNGSMFSRNRSGLALTLLVWILPQPVAAHFVLVAPDSWMSQDSYGSPQKLGPCGNEGGGTPTGKITAFHPGQTISITIKEVIPHPGHYRVALAVHDRSEIPPEPLVTASGGDPCASVQIQDPPVFPVLADHVLPHSQAFSGPQTFSVTLPSDVTCTKCTLQVLEFMSSHGAPCFYHHCADISIQEEISNCGDGQIQGAEQCDDQNTMSGDGCDSACRLECGMLAQSKLTIGKLRTPIGDERSSFQGSVVLPVLPALDPLTNGIRLILEDSGGTLLDVAIAGGDGWTVNSARNKWAYRSNGLAPTGGIDRVVIHDRSATQPGLVAFSIRGRRAAIAASTAGLPLKARLVFSPSPGQCGDSDFLGCDFNSSGNKLQCE